jgi:putative addiction module component (TIGR02574 family)
MPTRVEVLESEVLALPTADRSRLLERLIASLDADPEIKEAWLQEAARRDAQVSNNSVTWVPGEEAMSRLRSKLQ